MKAMILAAGRGERLRPLTDKLPKPLVTVAGKPLIEYHIERLAAMGVTELVINCAWQADKLIERLGDGSRFGVTIHYSREIEALETGGGIKKALPLLGNAPFLVINGDVFIDAMPELPNLAADTLAHLFLVDNPAQHPEGDFALLPQTFGYSRVSDSGAPRYTFSGVGIYRPELFDGVAETYFALAPLLRQKMEQGLISGSHFTGYWCDVGTLDRLQQLELRQAKGTV
ncbi:N-acetylmuramate alpha-1-phosphate uridylyltransferase MurU [Shewanella algae]|uniref:N-acetylmuramate alpha-1-phosphate uridylyltransferase MurU n=1 Tax=Shewanella algae TaxID=38313 RepID=UPI001BF06E92|nr:nucleotidyltransferase family protein [Shewanella algae]BCV55033.1 mannose-1-phosphate guanylyltransferase [Shewanella algae]